MPLAPKLPERARVLEEALEHARGSMKKLWRNDLRALGFLINPRACSRASNARGTGERFRSAWGSTRPEQEGSGPVPTCRSAPKLGGISKFLRGDPMGAKFLLGGSSGARFSGAFAWRDLSQSRASGQILEVRGPLAAFRESGSVRARGGRGPRGGGLGVRCGEAEILWVAPLSCED